MILVTGATGFVGRRLSHVLASDGVQLVALTRTEEHRRFLPAGTRVVIGDLTDPVAVERAVEGVDAIVHLAANLARTSDSANAFGQNVAGTRLLAKTARLRGVASFLHMSSASVYGAGSTPVPLKEDSPLAATSPYGRSKVESEQALVAELAGGGTRWVVLRPPEIHGPDRPQTLALLRKVNRKVLWLHDSKRRLVQPTCVDDVVVACQAVLGRADVNGEIFNLGGERPLWYQEWIELVARLLPHRLFQISLPALGGILNFALDSTKAKERLGLRPRPIAQWMAEYIGAYRAEGLL